MVESTSARPAPSGAGPNPNLGACQSKLSALCCQVGRQGPGSRQSNPRNPSLLRHQGLDVSFSVIRRNQTCRLHCAITTAAAVTVIIFVECALSSPCLRPSSKSDGKSPAEVVAQKNPRRTRGKKIATGKRTQLRPRPPPPLATRRSPDTVEMVPEHLLLIAIHRRALDRIPRGHSGIARMGSSETRTRDW